MAVGEHDPLAPCSLEQLGTSTELPLAARLAALPRRPWSTCVATAAAGLAVGGTHRWPVLPGPGSRAEPLGQHSGLQTGGTGGRLLGPGQPLGTRRGEVRLEELGDLIHLQVQGARGVSLGHPW